MASSFQGLGDGHDFLKSFSRDYEKNLILEFNLFLCLKKERRAGVDLMSWAYEEKKALYSCNYVCSKDKLLLLCLFTLLHHEKKQSLRHISLHFFA